MTTSLTVADFDAMKDDSKITALDFGKSFLTLALGTEAEAKTKIVGFKTASGTLGVIKITAATVAKGTAGKVTFDVKVQAAK